MDAAVRHQVEQKPVVIFAKSTCCMSHSINKLICSYGANPTVYDLHKMPNGQEIEKELQKLAGAKPSFPVAFIGQIFVGGPNDVISYQVQGKLVPMLMNAGAIWIWNRTN